MGRNGFYYPDPPPQELGQPPSGPNWPAIGTLVLLAVGLIAKALITRSTATAPATPTMARMGQPGIPWVPWALGGVGLAAAGTYGLVKLADYLDTPKTPAPTPTPAPLATQPEYWAAFLRQPAPPAPTLEPSTPAYTPPVDARWLTLAPHPSVILILGKRAGGTSALGYRLLELFRARATPYVVGMPQEARKLLPDWVGYADRLDDVPAKVVALLDEAYMRYHARDSTGADGRTIGQLVNLSRQKEWTLIFIVQEGRQIDVNVVSQADVVAVKELSGISQGFERRVLRRFIDKALAAFAAVKGNRQRWTWVYSEAAGGEVGLVEDELATFWKPALSRAFASVTPGQDGNGAEQPRGAKTPREELVGKTKSLKKLGHSGREIAAILGIPPSTTQDYLKEPD